MSEKITTPALRPTLEGAQRQFKLWRKRKRAGSRTPEALWQAAVELCTDHSVLRVSRALRDKGVRSQHLTPPPPRPKVQG
jgi:hypothetical protein